MRRWVRRWVLSVCLCLRCCEVGGGGETTPPPPTVRSDQQGNERLLIVLGTEGCLQRIALGSQGVVAVLIGLHDAYQHIDTKVRHAAQAVHRTGEVCRVHAQHDLGDILGMIHKEPVGVVGAMIPWNFPMMIGAWKLGPALAMGNSVVLKPSENASLSLMRMVELALEAGLPPGVLNAVTGDGRVVGETMGLSMDVDVVNYDSIPRSDQRDGHLRQKLV